MHNNAQFWLTKLFLTFAKSEILKSGSFDFLGIPFPINLEPTVHRKLLQAIVIWQYISATISYTYRNSGDFPSQGAHN